MLLDEDGDDDDDDADFGNFVENYVDSVSHSNRVGGQERQTYVRKLFCINNIYFILYIYIIYINVCIHVYRIYPVYTIYHMYGVYLYICLNYNIIYSSNKLIT